MVIWWAKSAAGGTQRGELVRKGLVEMAFEAYPPVAPDRLCQDWWHLSEEGKGALGPGNYISIRPRGTAICRLTWLIDLFKKHLLGPGHVLSSAQANWTWSLFSWIYGPVGWGGREKGERASRSLNVNCGRVFDTFLGKRKKPDNKQLPTCHYYCYCQNPLPLRVLVTPSCSFRKQTKLRTVGVPRLGILGASVFFLVLLYIF